jgi:hypothetical protein
MIMTTPLKISFPEKLPPYDPSTPEHPFGPRLQANTLYSEYHPERGCIEVFSYNTITGISTYSSDDEPHVLRYRTSYLATIHFFIHISPQEIQNNPAGINLAIQKIARQHLRIHLNIVLTRDINSLPFAKRSRICE